VTRAPAAGRELGLGEARARLVHASGLARRWRRGAAGAVELLEGLGIIQLDPIDRVGTNAELVAFARVDGLRRGELHQALAGHCFEHFAKERCLIHARRFPVYRDHLRETRWWRHAERQSRVDEALVSDVLAEVTERGPSPSDALSDRGRVPPIDWGGWRGTGSRTALALEVLWTRCALVVSTRDARGRRVYDLPGRALGHWATAAAPVAPLAELVVDRVRVAGLLARSGGPWWSMLDGARTDGTVEQLLDEGRIEAVRVAGRPYLALPEEPPPVRAPARVLGPLDPLLWNRALVRAAFDFDYVWEVYKPAEQRRWGYYVCPVVAGERFVGRVEARREGDRLVVDAGWDVSDRRAVSAAVGRLGRACGASAVDWPPVFHASPPPGTS